jgi:hypothetical protein
MQCFCNSWRVRNPLVMVLMLKKSLKYPELIPTADCSGPSPTFDPVNSNNYTTRVSLTMPEKIPFHCLGFSCAKMFTSDNWRLHDVNLDHPEHDQKNLPVHSAPRRVETAQRRECNANHDYVEDFDMFPYLEYIQNIPDTESRPPPPVPRTETYLGTSGTQIDYNAKPWERDALGCLGMNLHNDPYYPFVTSEEYKYIQCGTEKMGIKTYYDKVLKEEYTAQCFPSFKDGDRIQMLVACMPDVQALGEWVLYTLEDIRWNDNRQHPVKY